MHISFAFGWRCHIIGTVKAGEEIGVTLGDFIKLSLKLAVDKSINIFNSGWVHRNTAAEIAHFGVAAIIVAFGAFFNKSYKIMLREKTQKEFKSTQDGALDDVSVIIVPWRLKKVEFFKKIAFFIGFIRAFKGVGSLVIRENINVDFKIIAILFKQCARLEKLAKGQMPTSAVGFKAVE